MVNRRARRVASHAKATRSRVLPHDRVLIRTLQGGTGPLVDPNAAPDRTRQDQLVRALVDPHGGEIHIATLLSRWLSDREVSALVGWISRACNSRTSRYRDLLTRVVAALGDAG